jgi:hypothetical protein
VEERRRAAAGADVQARHRREVLDEMRRAGALALAALTLVACGSSGLKIDAPADGGDGASSDAPRIDARDDAAVDEAPVDAPPAGFRAYDITATVTVTPPAGEGGWVDFPKTHVFTLAWDPGTGTAFVGGGGNFSSTEVTTTDDPTFTSQTWQADVPLADSCEGVAHIRYEHATFSLTAGALTGTASGTVSYMTGDLVLQANITATLAGILDATAPSFTAPQSPVDPLAPLAFVASEPLAPTSQASLVGTVSGDVVALSAQSIDNQERATRAFLVPNVMLRAGETYTLVTDAVVDFVGNKPAAGASFSTEAAPPLVPEDGFESVTGTMFGGAGVLRGGTLTPIAGQTSLLLNTGFGGGFGFLPYDLGSSLKVRLAVSPGDTVVRFDDELIAPDPIDQASFVGAIRVASTGGDVGAAMNVDGKDFAKVTLPQDGDVYITPVTTYEIPLPAGAAGEVTLEIVGVTFACGLPPSPTVLVLDNLRVE